MQFKKSFIVFAISAVIVFCLLASNTGSQLRKTVTTHPTDPDPASLHPEKPKHILLWNHIGGSRRDYYFFGSGQNAFSKNNCKISNCLVTDVRNTLPYDEYDAVVFHIGYMDSIPPELPRKPHQRYVYFNLEPPFRVLPRTENYQNYFNWTMTYRNDSDIQFPYGKILPKETAPESREDAERMVRMHFPRTSRTKSKDIIWFVSNCKTPGRREELVQTLQKWIPVDIYGQCGVFRCKRKSNAMPECYQHMADNYKFYLSFENSLAKDYVTEKFFRVLDYDILPVVYGSADYERLAPYHSYVDARKFRNPEELAHHLKTLSSNETLYRQYFWWKKHYEVKHFDDNMADDHPFCQLCQKLHDQQEKTKTYNNIQSWEEQGIY